MTTFPEPPAVLGAHHVAFRCRDAEETRRFYEDVLGMRLAAAFAFETDPSGAPRPYMHFFFEMSDGRYLAFFDVPHTAEDQMFEGKDGMEAGHYAMEVKDREALANLKARLDTAGVANFGMIDHGFVHSLYCWDPNGLSLEFTFRDPNHDVAMGEEARSAHAAIRQWTEQTRELKKERLKNFSPLP